MNIDMKALKGVIEEIEASKVRQKGEAEFQREAIKRAVKQHQLDGKAIRIVLQRRAMGDEKRDEQDYYVHAYEHALGGKKLAADALASGATLREAAEIGGISTGAAGNLAKVVQKSEKLDTRNPHDMQANDPAPQGSPPGAPESVEVTSLAGPPVPEGGEGTGTHSDDDLDIPAHLRGPSPANRSLRP